MDKKPIGLAAIILTLFAILGTGIVAVTNEVTKERRAEQQLRALLYSLNQVVDHKTYDNDLALDFIEVSDRALLGSMEPLRIYRARKAGNPVAAVVTAIAPDGYSGSIKLLAGIRYDGSLSGVRVIQHKETPGLGDGVDIERSDWILGFNDKSLSNPSDGGWKVKKDGGQFDQLTGATITPRAIVRAVHRALQYYDKNRDSIFAKTSTRAQESSDDQ